MSWIEADSSSVAAATASTLAVDWAAADATAEADAAVAVATSPSRPDCSPICPAAADREIETDVMACSKLPMRRSRRSIRACLRSRLARSSSIIRSTAALPARIVSTARAMAPASSLRSRFGTTISVRPSASSSSARRSSASGASSRQAYMNAATATSARIPAPDMKPIRKKSVAAIVSAANTVIMSTRPRTRKRIEPGMINSLMIFGRACSVRIYAVGEFRATT